MAAAALGEFAAYISPFISESVAGIGEFAGSTVAEATGSQFLANTAKTTATSTAKLGIGEAAHRGIRTGVDAVGGQGTLDQFETNVQSSASSFFQSPKDYSSLLGLGYNPNAYNKLTVVNERNQQQTQQPSQGYSLSSIFGSSNYQNRSVGYTGPLANKENYDKVLAKTRDMSNNLSEVQRKVNEKYLQDPEFDFLNKKVPNPASKFDQIRTENPILDTVIQGIFNHSKFITTPDTSEYYKIARIYNGKNIDPKNFQTIQNPDGSKIFNLVNEVNQNIQWLYPEYNNYTVVPPLYDTWVGINSPNNTAPLSLLGCYAFFHDVSYKLNGSFNLEADLQLISRCAQNIQRMGTKEQVFAKIACNWFSTAGALPRAITGNLTVDIYEPNKKEEITAEIDTSIFPILVPESKDLSNIQYVEARKIFFDNLRENHSTYSTNTMSSLQAVYSQQINQKLIQDLEALEIQLN